MSKIRVTSDPPKGKYMTLREIQLFLYQVRDAAGDELEDPDAVPLVTTTLTGKLRGMMVEVDA